MNDRLADVIQFYELLDQLEKRHGGKRTLSECRELQDLPERGVYFFFEQCEERTTSGMGARVVRIGTHALKLGGTTTLWNRLSQHQGAIKSGGGNHRGSIFRLLVGEALMHQEPSLSFDTWGQGSSAPADIRQAEQPLERMVSRYLGQMQVLWLPVMDTASPDSKRGYIERNTISLLSNWGRDEDKIIDALSPGWLGHYSSRPKVRVSGLWNQRHVDEPYDPKFLDVFSELLELRD